MGSGPERLSDTNGGDDINAHVTGRFLRVLCCPPPFAAWPRGRPAAYDRAVTPLVPIAGGVVALAVAVVLLRSYGPRYRVARLLATVALVPLDEAIAAGAAGEPRYVRVEGRVDSEESFEDAARRPLVFRRTRLQARSRTGWRTFEDGREQVPFEVGDGLRSIQVDGDALDVGLVVIPRESTGTAADLGDRAPADVPPATAVRAVVEQISAVEQAVVLGVPVSTPDGAVRLTSGLGRPLVLTTLEPPEAMRVLGEGRRGRATTVAVAGIAGAGLLVLGVAWMAVAAITGSSW